MKREVEKLCFELNQNRISEKAVCQALGELSTRVEGLSKAVSGQKELLKRQTDLQEQIAKTKSNQKEVYEKLLKIMEEIRAQQVKPIARRVF